jgi:transcriptional regulator with XRE-family HTH domain
MGRAPSYKPARLGAKIIQIRRGLELSQNGLLRRLGLSEVLFQGDVSAYELGNRVPDLRTLLLLANLAGVFVDVLIDDTLDLPNKLPASPKSAGIRRKAATKAASRRKR